LTGVLTVQTMVAMALLKWARRHRLRQRKRRDHLPFGQGGTSALFARGAPLEQRHRNHGLHPSTHRSRQAILSRALIQQTERRRRPIPAPRIPAAGCAEVATLCRFRSRPREVSDPNPMLGKRFNVEPDKGLEFPRACPMPSVIGCVSAC